MFALSVNFKVSFFKSICAAKFCHSADRVCWVCVWKKPSWGRQPCVTLAQLHEGGGARPLHPGLNAFESALLIINSPAMFESRAWERVLRLVGEA